MHSSARLFYLACFGLWGGESAHVFGNEAKRPQSLPKHSSVCAPSELLQESPIPSSPVERRVGQHTYTIEFQYKSSSIVSDACASYSSLESINSVLAPQLKEITTKTDFFSHYRLNLFNKKCPFWSDESSMCGNIACSVNTLDNEEDIPLVWRAEQLGKLEGPKAKHPGKQQQRERTRQRPLQGQLGEDVGESCVVEYDDECEERDYCVPEDERASSKGDYVSLVDNPERFTGYSGAGAHQVWEAIYRENCFSKPSHTEGSWSKVSPLNQRHAQLQAANDLLSVMKERKSQQFVQSAIADPASGRPSLHELEFDRECLEKRIFYRIVSGMHASISTHLCYDYLDRTTGKWAPNPECFNERVGTYSERLSNIYFNYALLLRAVAKLNGHLNNYTFCSADPSQDHETKMRALAISDTVKNSGDIFDESLMFKSEDAVRVKQHFKQRFRNISRVMDCVGCDKCRLWGKVQTNGYGTALKILFEFDEANPKNDPSLRRTELVALINTLDRVSHSLDAIIHFRKLLEPTTASDTLISEKATEPESVLEDEHDLILMADQDSHPASDADRKPNQSKTITEEFYQELDLVCRAYKYVLYQWMHTPHKLWAIIRWESLRFWRAFLGLHPSERGWSFHFPGKDEL